MPLATLQHYSIEPSSLKISRDFYCEVLGLEDGFRPDLGYPGHWLYSAGVATVHLLGPRPLPEGRSPLHPDVVFTHTGRLDHIAFSATQLSPMRQHLQAIGVHFRENILPDAGLVQLLLRDPDGLEVELNFPYSEVEEA